MEKLTYKQAFDKITEAYIKGEIHPLAACFCFCGTLCGNKSDWCGSTYKSLHNDYGSYLGVHYAKMERALLDSMAKDESGEICRYDDPRGYEERLFRGMCDALEVLKQIHIERGENVEDFQFVKRQLV